MKSTSFLKSALVAVMAASMLVANVSAQGRGRGGDRGGGGGGDRGGGSSFSRGDGGGSSRSFSRGDGGSSQSFSRGNSGSSRSFSRGDSGSSRSLNRGDSGSSRSFSRGDSGASRQFSQPSDSGSRSFSRGSDQGSSQFRTRGSQDSSRSTFGRSDASRSGQFSDRSSDAPRSSYNRGEQTRQPYQANRPSQEQVRDFLQMREGSDQTRRDDVARRNEFNRENINRDQINRGDDQARRGDNQGRFTDRDVTNQFRDGDRTRDVDRDRNFDRNRDGDYERWRDGARGRDGRNDDDQRDWSGRWRDGDRFASANRIRDEWRGRDRNDYPFYGRWWNDGGRRNDWNWWGGYASRYNNPFYWWAWTTAPRLTTWVNFGWNRPYYWDYGQGEYIYYDNNVVYVNGRWYAPAPVFYDRTVQIVERAPELTPAEAAELEWLPLGVFAVTVEGSNQPQVLVQLAVTNDGVISGTASDQGTNQAFPIEGMVDKQTQRAVWSYNNDRNQRIVMETSIYNLTQAEATGMVHYGPEDHRVVQLVRLEQPQGAAAATTEPLPTP